MTMHESQRTTRLAPSPTGALHLGNVRTFLITWALARQQNMRIIMRIEDLDGPRVKPGAIDSTLKLLARLGIDWDGPPVIQSTDLAPHAGAMTALAAKRCVYPCHLTRSEIERASSAPHADDKPRPQYPAALRPRDWPAQFTDDHTNWRFVVPDESVTVDDEFAGPQTFNLARSLGDFVVWTRRAQPAYQLAVVVDDDRQGITDVIRGDDLLESAACQTLLYKALDVPLVPRYIHLPLVIGPDGRRLAKRHGDTRLARYLDEGVSPDRVIGLIAHWCQISPQREPMSADTFVTAFDLTRLDHEPLTMTDEDDQWLRNE
jgi:glutamyl-tRNA synthetase